MQWVSRILTVALMMALPGIVGNWLDQRWDTNFLAAIGFLFGLFAGTYYLLKITGAFRRDNQQK